MARTSGRRRRDHPDADIAELKKAGVAAVYTPKDFELDRIMRDIVALVAARNDVPAAA
jgi:(2R)-ethylmalonyl-CoA mutase